MIEFLFWAAVGLLVYHHIGYPAILRVLNRLRPSRRTLERTDCPAQTLPSLTLIVPAHNEALVIGEKVSNLLSLEYPNNKLKIIIALDGCTDSTKVCIENALRLPTAIHPIEIVEYPNNLGKVAVLNDQITRADTEVIALTDASAILPPKALIRTAGHFVKPSVGVVTGRYGFVDRTEFSGETVYWRYQSKLREDESTFAGPIGAHGAFYLFRRNLFTPLPLDTINDDFIIPMTIVLLGAEAVLEPDVTALELELAKSGQEARRRMRIGAGNIQQLVRLARLAKAARGRVAFAFLSGKGFRGILPFVLVLIFCCTIWLAVQGALFFKLLLTAQLVGLVFALCCQMFPNLSRNRYAGTIAYGIQAYLMSTIGAFAFLLKQESKLWRLSSKARHSNI